MIRAIPSTGSFYVIKTLDPRFLEPKFMELYNDSITLLNKEYDYNNFNNEVAYDQNGTIISNNVQMDDNLYTIILSRKRNNEKEFQYFLTYIQEGNSYNRYIGNDYEQAVFAYLDQL